MADLITRARALRNLNFLSTSADEDTLLDHLVSAASRAIENYCWRTFAVQDYDELYPGSGGTELFLRSYPITRIDRVACDPAPVVRAVNTSSSVQRASVQVAATGVILTRVASGVSVSNTLLFATYPTLSTLAAAITAVGNGWSAAVIDPGNNNLASADLRALQGAIYAKNSDAELKLHTRELSAFLIDALQGSLHRFDSEWDGGPGAWRVVYQAGYDTVPDDVQEACAQWVAQLFWQTKRDPGLASESISGGVARTALATLPATVKTMLAPYRNWRL